MSATAVSFQNVDIMFGKRAAEGLALLDQGGTRDRDPAAVRRNPRRRRCSLDVGEGEITVLMGLSGSGKSTLMRAVNGLNQSGARQRPGAGRERTWWTSPNATRPRSAASA